MRFAQHTLTRPRCRAGRGKSARSQRDRARRRCAWPGSFRQGNRCRPDSPSRPTLTLQCESRVRTEAPARGRCAAGPQHAPAQPRSMDRHRD
jgi:hypothetical protein